MERVFIYWDNSNIFHEAQRLAGDQDEGPGARYRVRIHFENLLRLAHANRPLQKAVVAGSVPPEMRQLWNRMENAGIEVHLFDRGAAERGEQEMPDRVLQLRMLEDALDFNGDPGIVVLLTGDGAGYLEGTGFHSTLERMHKRGWRVEILSWAHSTNQRMRRWAEANGIFVALDDFYSSITFMNPSRPGFELAKEREAAELDLLSRRVSRPRHVQREPRPPYNVVEIGTANRAVWESRHPAAVALADAVFALLRETGTIPAGWQLTYKQEFIGLRNQKGAACNFVRFRGRRGEATFDPQLPQSPDLDRRIRQAGLRVEYVAGNKRNRYRLTLAAADVSSHATLIQELATLALTRRARRQPQALATG